ncbi:MAG: nitroreductase family deazaflavin-dependent oxidoreductase [Chloroflexi bacterium]|nr:nitroreductase family deazaflavin-dependent oxidoreductase [Chloroflexota bacterium]
MPTWKRLLIAWFFVPVHRLLFRLSGGRLLGRLEGTGVLILVTKGRKSGKPRSSPLLYFRFGEFDDFIVVASNYGRDRHPMWYLNIAADPNVSVEANGERFAAEARITEGEERTALYDRVIATNPRFAVYYAATDRQIPVVSLRRVETGKEGS